MVDINSVKRALDVLNAFTFAHPECGVSEVAEKLGISKSTVSRIMSTLEKGNTITKGAKSRKYRLGRRTWDWAQIFLLTLDISTITHPHLQKLKTKTTDSVSVYVIDGNRRTCIDRIDADSKLRLVEQIGEYGPLHAGAPGKLLLAYLPEQKREELLAKTGLPRYTAHTITRIENLRKELQQVRKQGYAVSYGEHVDYVTSVSAPIRNYVGEVVASLSITGLTMRFTPQRERETTALVKEIATEISLDLGYREKCGIQKEDAKNA